MSSRLYVYFVCNGYNTVIFPSRDNRIYPAAVDDLQVEPVLSGCIGLDQYDIPPLRPDIKRPVKNSYPLLYTPLYTFTLIGTLAYIHIHHVSRNSRCKTFIPIPHFKSILELISSLL